MIRVFHAMCIAPEEFPSSIAFLITIIYQNAAEAIHEQNQT